MELWFHRHTIRVNLDPILKPYFSVAEKLKKMYTDSVKVSKSRPERSLIVPSRPRFSRNTLQMVYVDKSHDYCEKNAKEGSSGTRGRSVFDALSSAYLTRNIEKLVN